MRWTLTSGIAAAILLTACGGASAPPSASERTPATQPASASPGETSGKARAADAAPEFAVTTFEGDRFTLADHMGMPVVINFFDSW
jgi:hypothetical protein